MLVLIPLFVVLLNGRLECRGVGADDLCNLLALLEEEEGGHGADTELLSNVGNLVDIDLVESGVGEGLGEPITCLSAGGERQRGAHQSVTE